MTLTPGSRLGVFQLIDLIGRGGMGDVYRARDTKLDRDVAIEVLPESFAKHSNVSAGSPAKPRPSPR